VTKQIVDVVYYNNERLFPLSISGKGLPHPKDFGLHPFMISTACWRGFYCEYTIREDRLWLTRLVAQHDGEYPVIDGVKALYEEDRFLAADEEEPEFLLGRWVFEETAKDSETVLRELHYEGGIYENLNVPAPLTGGILLDMGDIDVPYIQYDFSYLSSSETILELLFEKGVLVKTIDHSAAIAAKRDELVKKQRPEYKSAEYDMFEADIKAWIRSTLTFNYSFIDIGWLREIYARPEDRI
jgi:hypothetical protein